MSDTAERHHIRSVEDENRRLREALEAVEAWWLSEGMKHFVGAPYAIFATRAALKGADK